MRAFFFNLAHIDAVAISKLVAPPLWHMVDSRVRQDVSLPHSPAFDDAFERAWELCDELLLDFFLLLPIPTSLCHFGRVGIQKEVIVA